MTPKAKTPKPTPPSSTPRRPSPAERKAETNARRDALASNMATRRADGGRLP